MMFYYYFFSGFFDIIDTIFIINKYVNYENYVHWLRRTKISVQKTVVFYSLFFIDAVSAFIDTVSIFIDAVSISNSV